MVPSGTRNCLFRGGSSKALLSWSSDFRNQHRRPSGQSGPGNQREFSGEVVLWTKNPGLLIRQLRYANTVVGPNPTEIDYYDYRLVSGNQAALPGA